MTLHEMLAAQELQCSSHGLKPLNTMIELCSAGRSHRFEVNGPLVDLRSLLKALMRSPSLVAGRKRSIGVEKDREHLSNIKSQRERSLNCSIAVNQLRRESRNTVTHPTESESNASVT